MLLLCLVCLLATIQSVPIGPRKTDKIAVIGAGPSGVAISHYLNKKGYEDITIFERTNRIGGLVQDIQYKGSTQAMTALAGLLRYWATEDLLKELGLEICPFPPNYLMFNPATQTNSNTAIWAIGYVGSKYGMMFSSPEEYAANLTAAVGRYSVLWSTLFGLPLNQQLRSEYLFPSTRPSQASLNDLSKPAIDWIVENNLHILEPIFRRLQDVNGYGPLDNVNAFSMMTWAHPSIFFSQINAWAPCLGFEAFLEALALPFRIKFNVDITSVVRTEVDVKITYNGTEEIFNWIIFTNKWVEGESDFIDLTTEEVDLFQSLETSQLKATLLSANTGTFVGEKNVLTLNVAALLPTWNPAVDAWTYGCHNLLPVRRPGDTSQTDSRVCVQCFYNRKNSTEAEQTAELNAFVLRMGIVPITSENFTIVTSVETHQYWQRYPNEVFKQGRLWDLWDLQGKNRSWYVGSAFAGCETVGDVVDYAKQLTDKFEERDEDQPEPAGASRMIPYFAFLVALTWLL